MSSRWHEHYVRGRPSYPVDAVRVAGLGTSSAVLEVGAGTGKLTRVLVDEFAEVVAVEPDPHMRSWFTALCPRAALLAGEAIGGLPENEAERLLDEVGSRLVHREYRLPFETDVHWTRLADERG